LLPEALRISANRRAAKWTARERLGRAIWDVLQVPLFRWTPRPLWAWRRGVLRLFGATVGRDVHIYPTARIFIPWNFEIRDEAAVGDRAIIYCLGAVRIGARATVSQYAHLCAGTHDHTKADMPLVKATIDIGEDAWICADAFVGPDVRVGARAVLGARGVAMRDLESGMIYAGNPALPIRERTGTDAVQN
jgi:putative colanic acid biosynthesis acetyltransferase WcaF